MRVQTSLGFRATRQGQELENRVANLLEDLGYIRIVPSRLIFAMQEMNQPIFSQQVTLGSDIYGKSRRCDLFIFHPIHWKNGLVIQCKWQAISGSVEEKYPFEVLNIKKFSYPTIVILDGGGYSKGSENWLKQQVDHSLLIYVLTLGEFQRFASHGNV